MSDVAERVKKIVVEHLGVEADKVVDSANFIDDLGADSLDTVELVMAFEEEFGVEIPGRPGRDDRDRRRRGEVPRKGVGQQVTRSANRAEDRPSSRRSACKRAGRRPVRPCVAFVAAISVDAR